jgi:hypothetical protein
VLVAVKVGVLVGVFVGPQEAATRSIGIPNHPLLAVPGLDEMDETVAGPPVVDLMSRIPDSVSPAVVPVL